MTVADVKFVAGLAGWLHEDLAAIRAGADRPEISRIISVVLVLESGAVACGDCVDVVFTGVSGRARPFKPEEHRATLEGPVRAFCEAPPLPNSGRSRRGSMRSRSMVAPCIPPSATACRRRSSTACRSPRG
jgi:hypothetical protein